MSDLTSKLERSLDRMSDLSASKRGFIFGLSAIFLYLLGAFYLHLAPDIDIFTRVASGRLTSILGTAPYAEPFTYLPHTAWFDHTWLASYLFYVVSQQGGDLGLFLLKCGFALSTLALLGYAQEVAYGKEYRGLRLALLFMAAPDLAGIWVGTVRAQVVAYLCLTALMTAFLRIHQLKSYRWFTFVPLILFVWVNSHGSYVIGLGFLGIFTLSSIVFERHSRDLPYIILVALLSLTLPLLTPYRFEFIEFSLMQISSRPYEIVEWAAVVPWTLSGAYRYFLAALPVVGLIIGGRRAIPWEGIAFIGAGIMWGLHHERLTPVMSISIACYGVPLVGTVWEYLRSRIPRVANFLRRGLVLGILFMASWGTVMVARTSHSPFALDYSPYPVEALDWLWNNYPGGKVFTHYNDGSFALWRLAPRFKISFDGRYDNVYPAETREIGFAAYIPGHPRQGEALRNYPPDFVLIGRDLPGACHQSSQLRDSLFPNFRLIYSDGNFCLLSKDGAPTKLENSTMAGRPIWHLGF